MGNRLPWTWWAAQLASFDSSLWLQRPFYTGKHVGLLASETNALARSPRHVYVGDLCDSNRPARSYHEFDPCLILLSRMTSALTSSASSLKRNVYHFLPSIWTALSNS